jgi:hypothetical protein
MKILLLMIALLASLPAQALSSPNYHSKTYAVEIEYGAANTSFLPLNASGKKMYGSALTTNPIGGNIIWAAAPGLNIGLSYTNYSWSSGDTFLSGPNTYKSPSVSIASISPFIDLAPLAFGNENASGITKGLFVEVGPAFTTLLEDYQVDGSRYSFATSGMFLEIRPGFRVLNGEPLSFVARARVSIPLTSDGEKSDTGLTLNGSVNLSAHVGACFSF